MYATRRAYNDGVRCKDSPAKIERMPHPAAAADGSVHYPGKLKNFQTIKFYILHIQTQAQTQQLSLYLATIRSALHTHN